MIVDGFFHFHKNDGGKMLRRAARASVWRPFHTLGQGSASIIAAVKTELTLFELRYHRGGKRVD